ncbi:MAG: tetratricopeptide repeat protein [Tannerella sp.]|jgi:signal transduction histidine kinase|nr:tetratricopeptide repeat protein [Tannerella sp.]
METVNIDSLEKILQVGNISPAEKLYIYDNLSWTYLETDIERAAELARLGLSLSLSQNEWFFAGHFYSHLGFSHYYNSRYDSAMFYFERMLSTAERLKPEHMAEADETEADAFTNIGITYDAQGQLKETIHYYLKGLNIAERENLPNTRELLYANLGRAYYCLKNYDKALYYYQKDIKSCALMNDSSKMGYALLGLSSIHLDRQEYDDALTYATQAHRLAMNHPKATVEDKIYSLQTLAEVHIKGNMDRDRAMEYARTALFYAEKWNSSVHKANSLRQMSLVSLQQGKYDDAEQMALQALAHDSSDVYANALLNEYIAKANIMMGNKNRALEAFDRQINLNRIYSDKNYQAAISEMEIEYETEKKEIQITALQEEKRLMIWLGIAVAAVLLLLLATFFFLWRWTVQKKRLAEKQKELAEQQIKQLEQEKQLTSTQAILDGEIQERTRLARDLHDGLGSMLTGVKFNLESLKGAAKLEGYEATYFNNAMKILNNSLIEMRRVAHHLMPDALVRHSLKVALKDFCDSFPIVEFAWFGSDEPFDSRKMEMMIYRIIHELVNNAFKHSGATKITVSVMREDCYIAFTVYDNGCGIDSDRQTQGMGLKNIRERVASCNGRMELDTGKGKGTEINIEFKTESHDKSNNS